MLISSTDRIFVMLPELIRNILASYTRTNEYEALRLAAFFKQRFSSSQSARISKLLIQAKCFIAFFVAETYFSDGKIHVLVRTVDRTVLDF
jgi:hypothetical protein